MNIYTIKVTEGQLDLVIRALGYYTKRQQQRNRAAARQLARLRPEYQASKVRDSLLLAGGLTLADLPGTTGDLASAIRHRTLSIAYRETIIQEGGGANQRTGRAEGGLTPWTL